MLSWNMLFNNAELERAFAFLQASEADIICLQEVPKGFLDRLRTLPYELVSAQEVERAHKSGTSTQYLAILSRNPVREYKAVRLPNRNKHDPLRTKLLVAFMKALGWWAQAQGERHSLIADLGTPEGPIRVFNLHLPLHRFAWRTEEFELAMAERDSMLPTIVCGDFNTLESRRIAILSWLLGGPLHESIFWRRERAYMQNRFAAHELQNPLRGQVTHPLSQSQLDHILVSRHFTVSQATTSQDSVGSDHRPVFARISNAAIAREHNHDKDERRSKR